MKRASLVIMLALGGGCATFAPAPRQDIGATVAASWRGRPVLDMEAHPVFSAMKREAQQVSDGATIYHHVRCVQWTDSQQAAPVGGFLTQAIAGPATSTAQHGEACCDRQFVVRAGLIEEYRQVAQGGECQAEAKYAPQAR